LHRSTWRAAPSLEEILGTKARSSVTARDVFEAAEAHDPLAQRVIADGIEFWGMATANLVSLFNPEKIIFGGGVFGPALRFLDSIMAEARKWAQPISINQVTLEGSLLGSDAGLYGAGFLALKSLPHDSGSDIHEKQPPSLRGRMRRYVPVRHRHDLARFSPSDPNCEIRTERSRRRFARILLHSACSPDR
jgi:hypothetical protein